MHITPTEISDVFIITPQIFKDERGYFFESYNKHKLDLENISYTFVQDNESKSSYGVIRGLHFQKPPHAQTKLLRVVQGAILDVAVDIRTKSPTFGKYVAVKLTAENHKQFLIPAGFAHGFSVLSETAIVQYKCTDYYHPETEGGLIYNDPTINIDWKIHAENAIISSKDTQQPTLADINSPF